MKLSEHGLDLIKRFEGLRHQAYQCAAGVWTIGYGHTANVKPGDIITTEEANAFLLQDVAGSERAVRYYVNVPLTQHQFDAIVFFTFNLGSGSLHTSTLLRLLNAGNSRGPQNSCFAGSMPAGNGSPGWYGEGRWRKNCFNPCRKSNRLMPVAGKLSVKMNDLIQISGDHSCATGYTVNHS